MPVYELFANSGIQYINAGMKTANFPSWISPQREDTGDPIGWLCCKSVSGYCILAVDTQTGPPELSYFAPSENMITNPVVQFTTIAGVPLPEAVEIRILPEQAGAGRPIDVALVLDFGNCRSMGLFVEDVRGATELESLTLPFRLYDHRRLGLDQFHPGSLPEKVERELQEVLADPPHESVFDSKFDLVADLLPQVEVEIEVEKRVAPRPVAEPPRRRGLFGRKRPGPDAETPEVIVKEMEKRPSDLFPDLSLLRFGSEADAFRMQIDPAEGILTGMSSPKRYLWAARPLTHNFWHQIRATPNEEGKFHETVRGKLLRYLYEDDRDWPQGKLPIHDKQHQPPHKPNTPQYPPRATMTLGLYELLSQAFFEVNSIAYRHRTSSPHVKRRLTHVVLCFPSGMCAHEKVRFRKQATKAILMTSHACVRKQQRQPLALRTRSDEGTAGQLAFIYGEIRACGTGRRWLEFVGRPSGGQADRRSVRIASLDIGGGTTDLTIADYSDLADTPLQTHLRGEIQYLDGMTKAGDELVLHLLEQILIPQMANELNVGKANVRRFFTATRPAAFAAKKRRWMTQIWIPVARHFLSLAEEENEQASFTLGEACSDDKAIDDLWTTMNSREWDWNVADPRDVAFQFARDDFERVLRNALGEMLYHFASAIASYDCDLLLLAGRTTRLPAVQRLLRWYLPFPKSRVVPLDRYPTGHWYPFQDPRRPGLIADPKSSVCVGSAVEYLCSTARGLGGIRVEIEPAESLRRAYHWGIANSDHRYFTNAEAIFAPDDDNKSDTATFTIFNDTIIARRLTANERAEVSPIYCISIHARKEHSEITVTLERSLSSAGEERLSLVEVDGTIDGGPAEKGRNVRFSLRTLFEERYFLDTETFYRIHYDSIIAD